MTKYIKSHTTLSIYLTAAVDGDGVFRAMILLELKESDLTNVCPTSDGNRKSTSLVYASFKYDLRH